MCFGAVRLTGDQVDGAGARGSELGAVGVVVQREVLGEVPQPGDRVAVVVVHHDPVRPVAAGVGGRALRAAAAGRLLDELVHQAAVEGFLLGGVAVVLVAGESLARIEPLRLVLVGVVCEQPVVQAVDRGRARQRRERRLTGRVGGVRVGPEIVVERDVLVEDDHDVLDRRGRCGGGGRRGCA